MEIGTKRLLQDFRQPGLSSRLLVQSHQLVQTVAAAATSGPTVTPAAAGAKPSAGANGRGATAGPGDPGRTRSGCYGPRRRRH